MSNVNVQRAIRERGEYVEDLDSDDLLALVYELIDTTEHRNHHDETMLPGRHEDGEAGYWTTDIRLVLDTDEARKLADVLEQIGYTDHADQIRETIDTTALTCTGCGRIGNTDDGIEMGGPCQYADDDEQPCDGTIVGVQPS